MLYWDRVAKFYNIFASFINRKVNKSLKKLIASKINKDDSVLECACGTGMLTEVIVLRCKEIIATDISKNMLKLTEKKLNKYENIKTEEGNIVELRYEDNSFDKVIAGNVLHLLDEPKKALDELIRVCRPEGEIIIPTYINKKINKKYIINVIKKTGANFKKEFTFETYKNFFIDENKSLSECTLIDGKIPCAVAVIKKSSV